MGHCGTRMWPCEHRHGAPGSEQTQHRGPVPWAEVCSLQAPRGPGATCAHGRQGCSGHGRASSDGAWPQSSQGAPRQRLRARESTRATQLGRATPRAASAPVFQERPPPGLPMLGHRGERPLRRRGLSGVWGFHPGPRGGWQGAVETRSPSPEGTRPCLGGRPATRAPLTFPSGSILQPNGLFYRKQSKGLI